METSDAERYWLPCGLCVMCSTSITKSRSGAIISTPLILFIIATLSIPVSFSLTLPKPDDWSSHIRARELCLHKQGGQEGTLIKGFQLSQVFIITTPGLRYNYAEGEQDSFSPLACHFKSFSNSHPSAKIRDYPALLDYKQKLKDGYHNTVSDFKIFSPFPSSTECRMDKLTSLGIAQSIWLGEYLSLAYHEFWSLKKDMALARTIRDDTLFQSASAVLYGASHEKQFVKNHVRKMGVNYGETGNSNVNIAAPDITADHSHYFIQASFDKEHHLFKDKRSPTVNRDQMNHLVGKDLSAKCLLSSVALTYCSGRKRKLNSFQGRVDVDSDPYSQPISLSHILSVSDGHNEYLSRDSFFQSYAFSRTLPFRKILQVWTQSAKSRHNPEVNLVTVDDLFYFSLLTSLNRTGVSHIPPVSRLVFEKFTFNTTHRQRLSRKMEPDARQKAMPVKSGSNKISEDHFYRVLLNGKVVTQELGSCSLDPMASLGLCSQPSIFAVLEGAGFAQSELRDEF